MKTGTTWGWYISYKTLVDNILVNLPHSQYSKIFVAQKNQWFSVYTLFSEKDLIKTVPC